MKEWKPLSRALYGLGKAAERFPDFYMAMKSEREREQQKQLDEAQREFTRQMMMRQFRLEQDRMLQASLSEEERRRIQQQQFQSEMLQGALMQEEITRRQETSQQAIAERQRQEQLRQFEYNLGMERMRQEHDLMIERMRKDSDPMESVKLQIAQANLRAAEAKAKQAEQVTTKKTEETGTATWGPGLPFKVSPVNLQVVEGLLPPQSMLDSLQNMASYGTYIPRHEMLPTPMSKMGATGIPSPTPVMENVGQMKTPETGWDTYEEFLAWYNSPQGQTDPDREAFLKQAKTYWKIK
jgi:hypothetical protein